MGKRAELQDRKLMKAMEKLVGAMPHGVSEFDEARLRLKQLKRWEKKMKKYKGRMG